MMTSEHNNEVLRLSKCLRNEFPNIFVAHVSEKLRKTHKLQPEQSVTDCAPAICAAFVPTTYIFSKSTSVDYTWKIPDIWVQSKDHWNYVIDICSDNDSAAMVARKIETLIHSAPNHKIAGIAMVHLSEKNSKQKEPKTQAKRDENKQSLDNTFWKLFARKDQINPPNTTSFLRAVMAVHTGDKSEKNVDWDSIFEVEIGNSAGFWQTALIEHITASFNKQCSLRQTTD